MRNTLLTIAFIAALAACSEPTEDNQCAAKAAAIDNLQASYDRIKPYQGVYSQEQLDKKAELLNSLVEAKRAYNTTCK